jgi:hypothetical protein
MAQKSEGRETETDHVILRPAVTLEDLKTDIEHDPEGAEEFVALIRTLRREGSRSLTRSPDSYDETIF